ncbi:hypothetical protein [Rubeoparvulum massiliense]|uniref:hypothetical protein n=1 Tax=Rubeoparvulum massiliense TaxID=1631346 RepID=UPI00065DD8BD|nr:hypothetical protein [Rubeoparvulum massiliense]
MRKLPTFLRIGLVTIILALSSGCAVPQDVLQKNNTMLPVAVQQIEDAVHQYYKEKAILPIVTKDRDTPIFEKYEIELAKLYPHYLTHIPEPAYEEGGIYRFVILDPEGEQAVRAMDLHLIQQVNDLQRWLIEYVKKQGQYPTLEEVEPGYYTLNEDKLGRQKAWIKSPFSDRQLPLLLHRSGRLIVDFRPEIQTMLVEGEEQDRDLRWLIVENTPFVPNCGAPIYWEEGKLKLDPNQPY